MPPRDEFRSIPTVIFMQFVKQFEALLAGRRVLLMIDEFEVVFEKVREGDFERGTIEFLRSLMQHHSHVLNFIVAGADGLAVMVGSYDKAMFNMALPIKVSYLDRAAARGANRQSRCRPGCGLR